jgi:hypothetical protein
MIGAIFRVFFVTCAFGCSSESGREPLISVASCSEPSRNGKEGIVISSSGISCLKSNLHVDGRWSPFRHGNPVHSDGYFLVAVTESNVVFDLRGHTLSSDAELAEGGVHSPSQTHVLSGGKGTLLDYPSARLVSNITIKNGALTLDRGGAAIKFTGFTGKFLRQGEGDLGLIAYRYPEPLGSIAQADYAGVALVHPSDTWVGEPGVLLRGLYTGDFFEQHSSYLPKRALDYPKRQIRLENLKIRAKLGLGVLIQGADTVIRNCTIEVDETQTAIYLYGPNALIENNMIIVNTRYPFMKGDASIRLFHGDGAVIRNNQFVFKGSLGHRHTVSTIDTGPFFFENNVITGAKEADTTMVSISGELQAKVQGTQFNRNR